MLFIKEYIATLIKKLGPSPTDITSEKSKNKIHEYLPVPKDFEILWAEIIAFGGHPAGIVFTDRGIVFKAGRKYVRDENKRRKEEEGSAERLKYIYQIVLWEDFDPALYSVEIQEENGKSFYILKNGVNTITEFGSSKAKQFFEDMAERHRLMQETIDQVSDDAVFAGIDSLFVEGTYFNAAYGADQSKTGHGIYAEHAGAALDRLAGEKATVVGGDNAKNGPDKLAEINGRYLAIQCKYCQTASRSVGAAFAPNPTTGLVEYRYYSLSNEPMAIEVPKDQYEQAVEAFRSRIAAGQVPGVTDPADASKYVRRGRVTYAQARNLAEAGTIESLAFDAYTGAISCSVLSSISAVIAFSMTFWKTKDYKKAARASLSVGLQVFGTPFAGSILASQIARTGLSDALIPASDTIARIIGPKSVERIINATRALVGKKAIYGAAAQKSFAKVLRTNFITQAAMFVAIEAGDIVALVRRHISVAQYVKNMLSVLTSMILGATFTLAAGMAMSYAGSKTGKEINKKIGAPVGAVCGFVGGALGSFAVKQIGGLIREDDTVITTRLFNACLTNLAIEYLVSEVEMEKIIASLNNSEKGILKVQKNLVAKDDQYQCCEEFLRPLFKEAVATRSKISRTDELALVDSINDLMVNAAGEVLA